MQNGLVATARIALGSHEALLLASPSHLAECGPCRSGLVLRYRAGCDRAGESLVPWLRRLALVAERRVPLNGRDPSIGRDDLVSTAVLVGLTMILEDRRLAPEHTLVDDDPSSLLLTSMCNRLRDGRRRSARKSYSERPVVASGFEGSDAWDVLGRRSHAKDCEMGDLLHARERSRAAARAFLAWYDSQTERDQRVLALWWTGQVVPECDGAEVGITQTDIGRLARASQATVSRVIGRCRSHLAEVLAAPAP